MNDHQLAAHNDEGAGGGGGSRAWTAAAAVGKLKSAKPRNECVTDICMYIPIYTHIYIYSIEYLLSYNSADNKNKYTIVWQANEK